MPDINTMEKIPRKILPAIYILDASGSMEGNRIETLNQAMNTTAHTLKKMEANAELHYEIRSGVLSFADNVKWLRNGLENTEDFTWDDVEASGAAVLGAALRELNEKMWTRELFQPICSASIDFYGQRFTG